MSDWEERFPNQLSDDQQQAILDQLNAAQDTLRKKREEEAQVASEGREISSEGDSPTHPSQANTEASSGFSASPQEQLEKQWQDSFEGIEKEPGEHTTAEFERIARAGFEQETFEILEGNRVTIRTLVEGEEDDALIRAARHPQAYMNRAYGIYRGIYAMQAINGKPWYRKKPLSPDEDLIEEKFLALKRWHPSLIDMLINRINILQNQLLEKARYAGKGSETTGSGES